MATRFWVGGTDTWDGTAGTKWAATSGGAGGASAPGASDSVFFDANSGSGVVTYGFGGQVVSLDFTGFTGTFTSGGGVLSINTNGLTLGAGMTYSANINYRFNRTGAGNQIITSNGKSLAGSSITGIGNGNTVVLGDDINTTGSIDISGGITGWSAAGKNVTAGSFVGPASGSPVSIGNGTYTLSGTNGIGNTFDVGSTIGAAPTGSPNIVLTNSGASPRTVKLANGVGPITATLTITAGTGTVTTVGGTISSLTPTGFSGSFTNGDTSSSGGTTTTLAAALNLNGAFTLVAGNFSANNLNVTVNNVVLNGTNGRTLTMGSGTWTLTGTGTIWNSATTTALVTIPGTSTVDCTNSSSSARTITCNAKAINNLKISAGTGNLTLTSVVMNGNLDCTGFTGAVIGTGAIQVAGSLTLDAGQTWTCTGSITFNATSGTKTITTNGVSIAGSLIFNGVGGTWQLQDDLTFTNSAPAGTAMSHTAGTIDFNNKNVTVGGGAVAANFTSSGATARTITLGSGTLTFNSTTQTCGFTASGSNLTINKGTGKIAVGATSGTTSIGLNGLEVNDIDLSGTGSTTITPGSGGACNNIRFLAASTRSISTNPLIVKGNFTIAAGAQSLGGTVTFGATSGTKTITGATVGIGNITFDGVGGTWQLVGGATTGGATTLTNGTLDLNGTTLTTGTFSTSNANARSIKFNGGSVTTTSTGAVTVFDASTSTNLTVDRTGGGSITISGNTTNIRTFDGGGKSWPTLTVNNSTASGQVNIASSNTFTGITGPSMALPATIAVTDGTTQTLESGTFPSGAVGTLLTVKSTGAGTHAFAKTGGGFVAADYLAIDHSNASPGSTWYAGTHSTDNGNNTGWIFSDPTVNLDFIPSGAVVRQVTSGITLDRIPAGSHVFNVVASANVDLSAVPSGSVVRNVGVYAPVPEAVGLSHAALRHDQDISLETPLRAPANTTPLPAPSSAQLRHNMGLRVDN